MTKTGTIFVSLIAASILFTVPAAARTITVNCNEGMTVSNAISKLDPMDSNAIRVIGTCSEFIWISGFAHLLITGVTTSSGPEQSSRTLRCISMDRTFNSLASRSMAAAPPGAELAEL